MTVFCGILKNRGQSDGHSLRELIPGHLQGNFQEIPYKCPVCCPKPEETDRTIKVNLLSVHRRFSSLFAVSKLL